MDSGITSLSRAIAWAIAVELRFYNDHVYPPAGTIVSKVILPSSALFARLICTCVPLGSLFFSPGRAVGIQDELARVTAVFAGDSTGNTAVFAGELARVATNLAGRSISAEPGFLPAGILGTGVPSSGVLPEASLRQDITPVIPLSRVPLRPEQELWASDDVLETVEPGALMFPKEGLHLRKMNPEPLSLLSSLVGGCARPRHPLTDPFSSPVPSGGNVSKADSEAGDLANIRWEYLIHHSLGMRSPTEFERAPDGGAGEVAVYEAYLEAGFRGAFPSLIGEVSSFFGFSPSQLTPLTWRTLMALQVLGKLHGFSIGVLEILYSYCFAPLANKDGFYHLRSRDSAPLVEEPSRGVRGNHTFDDGWNSRYVFVKIQEPVGYPTSWRTVDVSRPVSFAREAVAKLIMGMPRRFRWVTFLVSRETLRHSHVWGNAVRLARVDLSAGSLPSISSTSAEIMPNWDLLADAHRRLTREALLFRGQVQDMMACRDLLIQQVRALARWELMKEWLEKRVDHWNPEEEYRRHLFLSGGFNHRS
ncbi:hypothetical protein DY000_02050147 [Brassica cretica]|uniref:Aminotransferase-like plant mobile domain-containing protein n=1 Tax=Brassica cretica TaxID=69181 RepID=A0ABQ7EXV3_BRACR|nr:hypothetical protein DY000_02050147 [Brassica cretica]